MASLPLLGSIIQYQLSIEKEFPKDSYGILYKVKVEII